MELRQMLGGVGCDKKGRSWWIRRLVSGDIKTKRTDLRVLFFYNKTEGMN